MESCRGSSINMGTPRCLAADLAYAGKMYSGRNKHSTFYPRDTGGKLVVSTYWNSDAAPNYYKQPWHTKGQCAWAAAIRMIASPQPRTNCAMGLYKDGALFGVSTIDINLSFFNSLIQDKEKEVQGQIMIVERDGKILTNQSTILGEIVLKNVADFSNQSLFAKQIQKGLRNLSGSNLYQQEYEDPT